MQTSRAQGSKDNDLSAREQERLCSACCHMTYIKESFDPNYEMKKMFSLSMQIALVFICHVIWISEISGSALTQQRLIGFHLWHINK